MILIASDNESSSDLHACAIEDLDNQNGNIDHLHSNYTGHDEMRLPVPYEPSARSLNSTVSMEGLEIGGDSYQQNSIPRIRTPWVSQRILDPMAGLLITGATGENVEISAASSLNSASLDRVSLLDPVSVAGSIQDGSVDISEQVTRIQMPEGSLVALPEQKRTIEKRRGTSFTLMVAGESGTGKTTFVNTLFADEISSVEHKRGHLSVGNAGAKTTSIEIHQATYVESGFEGRFTIVDTPGFGDYINNQWAWVPLVNFIDARHRSYMCQEEQPDRTALEDTRVHACVYFLQPTGHELLPLDIKTMQELSRRVNLIPVIAKADSLTTEDLSLFKYIVREALVRYGITTFQPTTRAEKTITPQTSVGDVLHGTHTARGPVNVRSPENAELSRVTTEWPFAIVGSKTTVTLSNGQTARGRVYRWGTVDVQNHQHSDFVMLRDLLFGNQMLELLDTTHEVHYARQRTHMVIERLRTSLIQQSRPMPRWVETLAGAGPTFPVVDATAVVSTSTSIQSSIKRILPESRPSVSFLASGKVPTTSANGTIADYQDMVGSNMDIVALIAPFGKSYLDSVHLDNDQLYNQRVGVIRQRYATVARFQEEKFKQWAAELSATRDASESEITALHETVADLQQQVSSLEKQIQPRRKLHF